MPRPAIPPRRSSSDLTHVSDSEPEREACRRDKPYNLSPPDSPSPQRTPLSSVHNTLRGTGPIARHTLECRLLKLEDEMAEIKHEMNILRKRSRTTPSPPSTPLAKRARLAPNDAPISETPILRSSLMLSTPERDEMSRRVSEDIQLSLRRCQRQYLLSRHAPITRRRSGMKPKLRRRVHEFMDAV